MKLEATEACVALIELLKSKHGGMMSIKCVTYNHDVIEILKQWRNEGGGQYNQKYKSWNYFKPFSDTVFQRLQEMDSSPKQ